DVLEAVVEVGQRALAGSQELEAVELQRQLAAAAADGDPLDADDRAEAQVLDLGEALLAQAVEARDQLDAAGAVVQVEARGLAHAAAAEHAPGQAVARVALLTGAQGLVQPPDRVDRRPALEPVRQALHGQPASEP